MRLGDIGRLWRIGATFSHIGMSLFSRWSRLHLLRPVLQRLSPQRAARLRIPAVNVPRRIRLAFEELGPTFVKLGQLLSVRPDLAPAPYVAEFERLRSQVASFPPEEARQIIIDELGHPPERLFTSFSPVPLAAASIAQVHEAMLPSGEHVAVKIQRPGVRRAIEQDIRLLRWFAGVAERYSERASRIRPVRLVEEFADWTLRELDFRVEGLNADHFRHDFADDPDICIPKVYWPLTTARVLTLEFINGVRVDDLLALRQHGIDPAVIARKGVRALFKQIFINGYFHGDLHPGNFFALPGDRICYEDFGIVGYLQADVKRELTSFFIAFQRGDTEAAVGHFLDMSSPLPGGDTGKFRRDLYDLIGAWHYTGRQSLAQTFLGILRAGVERRIAFPQDLALLTKSLITVEAVGYALYPEFDIDEELRPFIVEVYRSILTPKRVLKSLESSLFDYAHTLQGLPEHLNDILDTLARGQISIQIDTHEIDTLKNALHQTGVMRVLAPLVIALIVASAISLRAENITEVGGVSVAMVWFASAAVLGVWLLYLLLKR